MAVLPILTYPDPRLRDKARPVDCVDDSVRKLMDDLRETILNTENCGGLASTQVGDKRAVVVFDIGAQDGEYEFYFMANPQITWKSPETKMMPEGCMSVPHVYNTVRRHLEIEVTYLDYNNELRKIKAQGRLAHVIQHETDHLDGTLNIDLLSPLKRRLTEKKMKKYARQSTE